MTRNRTALDVFSTVGNELMVLLLLVLATAFAVTRHFSMARDRMRRLEGRIRRRAARRIAA